MDRHLNNRSIDYSTNDKGDLKRDLQLVKID